MFQRSSMVAAFLVAGTLGTAHAACQLTRLISSHPTTNERFGGDVTISGDVAIISALEHMHETAIAGGAFVFRLSDGEWVEEQEFLAPDIDEPNQFGSAVAIDGVVAVVAAASADDVANDAGAAYVYRWDGAAWNLEQTLMASDGVADDRFGGQAALSGDVAIIGASRGGDGAAYVFRWDGKTWNEEQILTASDGVAGDDFASHAVAFEGDVVIIGARGDDDNGSNSGSAYVFRYDGATWNEEQKLTASDGSADDLFGAAAAISGDAILVGASMAGGYAFRWDGLVWNEEQKLVASDAEFESDRMDVALEGETAVVGAPGADFWGTNSGIAHVFRWDGAEWTEDGRVFPADLGREDLYGNEFSLSGNLLFAGNNRDSPWGSVTVFDLALTACPQPGGCCLPGGVCLEVLEIDCTDAGGVFQGETTACGDSMCPPACVADVDLTGDVGFSDLLTLLAAWGPCP